MILKNVDEVLAGIVSLSAKVTDDMFDMGGEIFWEAEQDLPFAYEAITRLYPIKNGIKFMRENYPDLDIQLRVSEIDMLTRVDIKLILV